MSGPEIADAEIVPEQPSPVAVSTEIVRRERRSEVLKPLDPDTLLESFTAYQQLLQRLLVPEDWQGPPNRPGSFVKKRGWRKIATAFDLDVQMVRSEVERDPDGTPVRAEVWARAVAPSGRLMDGDGYCSADEPRFQKSGGRQKLENDLRATATTRAMNRAISGLIGMGDVSAEEVDATPSAGPPYGRPAEPAQVLSARNALAYLADTEPDSNLVGLLLNQVEQAAGGYLPHFTLAQFARVAGAVRNRREATAATETNGQHEERERPERLAAEAA